jgi:hypothetical protein
MVNAGSQGINMLNTLQNRSMRGARLQCALAACLLAGSGAAMAANVTVNLCATTGVAASPVSVPVYGYAAGACPSTVSAPGGPVITVDVGDVVTVNLQNSLPQASGLLFQGQRMVPDTRGAPAAVAAQYGVRSYTFTATSPGTFLYEAAPLPHAEYQAVMGLHGALVVRPAPVALGGPLTVTPAGANAVARVDAAVAYSSGSTLVTDAAATASDVGATVSGAGIPAGATIVAVTDGVSFTMSLPAAVAYGAGTDYNEEAVLVLSEVDPMLHASADPAAFDMRTYAPRFFLINGKPYPDTEAIASAGGHKVLLRYVNAGARHHSMAVLGPRQLFVAKDASTLPTMNHNVAAETLAPGQTGDALLSVPALASTSRYAVYDAGLALHNSNAAGFGGMLTFVTAGAGATVTGPSTSAVVLTPSPTRGDVAVALSATIASAATTSVAAAEFYIDTTAGTGTAMTGAFGTPLVSVTATLPVATLAALASGSHTVYVRGQDATLAWGGFSSGALNVDKTGPATTGLTLTPNPSNGAVSVALAATGNDSGSGGANVTVAEYTIDGGAPLPMALGGAAAPVRSLSATIAAGLAAGTHSVAVRSQDALGNWGPVSTIPLTVLSTPPVTSGVSAARNPNNGAVPLSATQPVVRISATLTSAGATIAGAEGFIDASPASTNVRGFPFTPGDGAWNSASEAGYADIPLTTINALAAGPHTIYVRGKDATNRWGATSSTVLLIDKTAPTIGSLSPATTTLLFGTASATLTVSAADVGGAGLAGGQYWIDGTATPPAGAIAFTGTSVVVNTAALAAGSHTVRVRVQDGATNWSTASSATLLVVRAVNDTRTIAANIGATQNSDASGTASLLANDQPVGQAGRTTTIASVPVRTAGTGTGTLTLSCPPALGAPAAPSAGGNTVCTNGAYRATLTGVGTTGAQRQASKRGTFQFTYTETLNGVTSAPATVTITVN